MRQFSAIFVEYGKITENYAVKFFANKSDRWIAKITNIHATYRVESGFENLGVTFTIFPQFWIFSNFSKSEIRLSLKFPISIPTFPKNRII